MKHFRGRIVATSFVYLTVHRCISGDVPIYLNYVFEVTHSFRKRRFRQISLNSASAVRASEKSSSIANRKSIMRFPSSHIDKPCALPLIPPISQKGGSKREFFTFSVAFHISVACNRRHFKVGMPIYHSKSQPPKDDKLYLKWAWSRHVIHFKFQSPKHTVKFLSHIGYTKMLIMVVFPILLCLMILF